MVIARPAASSLAPLMRRPVESRYIATPAIFDAEFDAFEARMALMLVLMTAMVPILHYGSERGAPIMSRKARTAKLCRV